MRTGESYYRIVVDIENEHVYLEEYVFLQKTVIGGEEIGIFYDMNEGKLVNQNDTNMYRDKNRAKNIAIKTLQKMIKKVEEI